MILAKGRHGTLDSLLALRVVIRVFWCRRLGEAEREIRSQTTSSITSSHGCDWWWARLLLIQRVWTLASALATPVHLSLLGPRWALNLDKTSVRSGLPECRPTQLPSPSTYSCFYCRHGSLQTEAVAVQLCAIRRSVSGKRLNFATLGALATGRHQVAPHADLTSTLPIAHTRQHLLACIRLVS